MNELPDLSAKIQVGLFNVLEEGTTSRSAAIRSSSSSISAWFSAQTPKITPIAAES